jgi:hypothetical protein
MIVEMVDPEGQALREIADPRMKRDDVALTYAFVIRQGCSGDRLAQVNRAIIERWSMAALKYIKERAWGIAEGRIQP